MVVLYSCKRSISMTASWSGVSHWRKTIEGACYMCFMHVAGQQDSCMQESCVHLAQEAWKIWLCFHRPSLSSDHVNSKPLHHFGWVLAQLLPRPIVITYAVLCSWAYCLTTNVLSYVWHRIKWLCVDRHLMLYSNAHIVEARQIVWIIHFSELTRVK